MEQQTDIKIGIGLGNIKFGITREDLLKIAGEPSETEQFSDENYITETWHYDEDEFSVAFDEEDNWRLTTIAVSSAKYTLSGNKLIALSFSNVLGLIKDENLGDNELEDIGENQQILSFVDKSINFWFENKVLSEIQWGLLWEDEDTPIWPK